MKEISKYDLLFFLGVCLGCYSRCLKLDGRSPQDCDFEAMEILKKLIIEHYKEIKMENEDPKLRTFEELKRDFEATIGKRGSDNPLQFQRDKILFEAMIKINNRFEEILKHLKEALDHAMALAKKVAED